MAYRHHHPEDNRDYWLGEDEEAEIIFDICRRYRLSPDLEKHILSYKQTGVKWPLSYDSEPEEKIN